jgi:hypothetical protein
MRAAYQLSEVVHRLEDHAVVVDAAIGVVAAAVDGATGAAAGVVVVGCILLFTLGRRGVCACMWRSGVSSFLLLQRANSIIYLYRCLIVLFYYLILLIPYMYRHCNK